MTKLCALVVFTLKLLQHLSVIPRSVESNCGMGSICQRKNKS